MMKAVSIKWDGNPPLCRALALPVGRKKRTGEVKIAPKERLDRVNEVGTICVNDQLLEWPRFVSSRI